MVSKMIKVLFQSLTMLQLMMPSVGSTMKEVASDDDSEFDDPPSENGDDDLQLNKPPHLHIALDSKINSMYFFKADIFCFNA